MPSRLMASYEKAAGDVIASFNENGFQCNAEEITNICPWDELDGFKFKVEMLDNAPRILTLNQELTWTENWIKDNTNHFWIKLIKNGENLAFYNRSYGVYDNGNPDTSATFPLPLFIRRITLV